MTYYTNTSTAADGTSVDAADVNQQFAGIETAFAAVEVDTNASVRGPDGETLTQLPAAATRADKGFGFNASGQPEATVAWRQNWSAGGFKLTDLAAAVSSGDAVSYGFLLAYSGALLGLPTLSTGWLYSNGSTLSWADPFPTAPTQALYLSYINGANRWARVTANVLPNPSGLYEFVGWTQTGASFGNPQVDNEFCFQCPGGGTNNLKSDKYLLGNTNYYIAECAAGATYHFSAEHRQYGAGAVAQELFIEWYSVADALLSTSTQAIGGSIAASFSRTTLTAVAPGSTQYARMGVRSTSASTGAMYVRRMKFEPDVYGGPTPFTDETTKRYAWLGKAITAALGAAGPTVTFDFGLAGTTTTFRKDYHSVGSGSNDYDVRHEWTGGTAGTNGKGVEKVEAGALKVTGALGFHATHALGNLGATETIDWANGSHQSGTLDANCTLTINSPSASYPLGVYRLYLLNDATSPRTMAWAGTAITWAGGISPPANTTNGTTIVYLDWNGTKFWGQWTQFA